MHFDWTLRSGIKVVVRNYADWCTYNELFVNHEYSDALSDAIQDWRSGSPSERYFAFDLGANVGYFTLQLADRFLRECQIGTMHVSLIEASPRAAAQLRRRLMIDSGRVTSTVITGLVGRRDGSAKLNLGREDTLNFVGDPASLWSAPRGAETVSYVDLDLLTAHIPIIHLIKCDIEGSEFEFIEAYPELLRKTRRLIIEFHAPFGDIVQATETLKQVGFTKASVLREASLNPTIYFSRV